MSKLFLKSIAPCVLLLLAASCGGPESSNSQANESQVFSLVGYPCQGYGKDLNDERFQCVTFNVGSRVIDVLFQMDGMNSDQMTKLKSALLNAGKQYSNYWTDAAMNPNGSPALLSCILLNAKTELVPKDSPYSSTLEDDSKRAIWAITALQFGFSFHESSARPIIITGYDEALGSDGSGAMAHAAIGNDSLTNIGALDFGVNRVTLNQPSGTGWDYSSNAYSGAIIHEMLHRRGYTHSDPGRSRGPMVYEFGNCITDLHTSPFKLDDGFGNKLPRVD